MLLSLASFGALVRVESECSILTALIYPNVVALALRVDCQTWMVTTVKKMRPVIEGTTVKTVKGLQGLSVGEQTPVNLSPLKKLLLNEIQKEFLKVKGSV